MILTLDLADQSLIIRDSAAGRERIRLDGAGIHVEGKLLYDKIPTEPVPGGVFLGSVTLEAPCPHCRGRDDGSCALHDDNGRLSLQCARCGEWVRP